MIFSPPPKYVFGAQAFEALRLENARLQDENAWLRSAYEDQQKINAQLAARIEELERRLKLERFRFCLNLKGFPWWHFSDSLRSGGSIHAQPVIIGYSPSL